MLKNKTNASEVHQLGPNLLPFWGRRSEKAWMMNCNVTLSDVYLQMSICMSWFAWEKEWGNGKDKQHPIYSFGLVPGTYIWALERRAGCMQSLKEVFLKDTCKVSRYRLWCFWSRDDTEWKHLEVSHIWHGYQSHHAWYWRRYWASTSKWLLRRQPKTQETSCKNMREPWAHRPQPQGSEGHDGWGQKIYIYASGKQTW